MKIIVLSLSLLFTNLLFASTEDLKSLVSELRTFKENGNRALRKLEKENRFTEARLLKERLQSEYNERQQKAREWREQVQVKMDQVLEEGGSNLSAHVIKMRQDEIRHLKRLIKREHYMIGRMRTSLLEANESNRNQIKEIEEEIEEGLLRFENDMAHERRVIQENEEKSVRVIAASRKHIADLRAYIESAKEQYLCGKNKALEKIKYHESMIEWAEQEWWTVHDYAMEDIARLEMRIANCLNAECRDPLYRKKHEIQAMVANETYTAWYGRSMISMTEMKKEHQEIIDGIQKEIDEETYSGGYMCSMPGSLEAIRNYENDIRTVNEEVKNRTYYSNSAGWLKSIDEHIAKAKKRMEELAAEKADGRYYNIGHKRRQIEELRAKIALRTEQFNNNTWGPIVGMLNNIQWNEKRIAELMNELGLSDQYKELESLKKVLTSASNEVVEFEVIDPKTKLPLWFRTLQKAMNIYDDVMEITRVKRIFDKVKDMNPFKAFDTFIREYGGEKGFFEMIGDKLLPKRWMDNEHVRTFFKDYDHNKLMRNIVIDGVNPLKEEMEALRALSTMKLYDYRYFLEDKGSEAVLKAIESSPKLKKLIELQEKIQAAQNSVELMFDDVVDKSFSLFENNIDKILEVSTRANYVERTASDIVNTIRDVKRLKPEDYKENLVKAYAKTATTILKKEYGFDHEGESVSLKENLINEFTK